MRTLLATVLLALLISGSGGCAVTPDMWRQANSRVMEYPHLVGSIAGPTDHPAALVVCYPVIGEGMSHDRNFYVLLHLNPDGSPPEPFAAYQHASDLLTADAELGPTRRQQIRDFIFPAGDWTVGKQAMSSSQFRKLDDAQGISTIESMRNQTADRISTLAYWPAAGTALIAIQSHAAAARQHDPPFARHAASPRIRSQRQHRRGGRA